MGKEGMSRETRDLQTLATACARLAQAAHHLDDITGSVHDAEIADIKQHAKALWERVKALHRAELNRQLVLAESNQST